MKATKMPLHHHNKADFIRYRLNPKPSQTLNRYKAVTKHVLSLVTI